MAWLSDPQAWVTLLTLTALEIVLGIDNIIFISILAGKLPEHRQHRARQLGLLLALFSRIALLLGIAWVAGLTDELFQVLGVKISGRDLILIVGGLFLIFKSTTEIHQKLEGENDEAVRVGSASFGTVLIQIMLLDVVFSLDSVITAVGMSDHLPVMIIAVVLAVMVMLVSATPVSAFIERHPTLKVLALSFLLLIGTTLIVEGMGWHVPKGYIYFAMAFSLLVETLNLRVRRANT